MCGLVGHSAVTELANIHPVLALLLDLTDTTTGGDGHFEQAIHGAIMAIDAIPSDAVFFVIGYGEFGRLALSLVCAILDRPRLIDQELCLLTKLAAAEPLLH